MMIDWDGTFAKCFVIVIAVMFFFVGLFVAMCLYRNKVFTRSFLLSCVYFLGGFCLFVFCFVYLQSFVAAFFKLQTHTPTRKLQTQAPKHT